MDVEISGVGAAAAHVLKQIMLTVLELTDKLQPLAGGKEDGTTWSDHWDPTKGDILKFFSETLDLFKPAVMDGANKSLRKVA